MADLDKVAFVLGNIRNHFDGMGGPDKVTIALVVHGPALKALLPGFVETERGGMVRIAELQTQGYVYLQP